jgi:hypothetical protein
MIVKGSATAACSLAQRGATSRHGTAPGSSSSKTVTFRPTSDFLKVRMVVGPAQYQSKSKEL